MQKVSFYKKHGPRLDATQPGRVQYAVACLATDTCVMADTGVVSSIPVWSHTFLEIDIEIISAVFLLPSTE